MTTKTLNSFFSNKLGERILVKSIKKHDPMGSGFVIKSSDSKYFLKEYRQTRTIDDIKYEHDFVNYLGACGIDR